MRYWVMAGGLDVLVRGMGVPKTANHSWRHTRLVVRSHVGVSGLTAPALQYQAVKSPNRLALDRSTRIRWLEPPAIQRDTAARLLHVPWRVGRAEFECDSDPKGANTRPTPNSRVHRDLERSRGPNQDRHGDLTDWVWTDHPNS